MYKSTRPDCPVCKNPSLTGWLVKHINDSLITTCMVCNSKVIMTEQHKIIGWKKYEYIRTNTSAD